MKGGRESDIHGNGEVDEWEHVPVEVWMGDDLGGLPLGLADLVQLGVQACLQEVGVQILDPGTLNGQSCEKDGQLRFIIFNPNPIGGGGGHNGRAPPVDFLVVHLDRWEFRA